MSQHKNEPEAPVQESELGEELTIRRTVASEAQAVQASNRNRPPVVSTMTDGTKRIDF